MFACSTRREAFGICLNKETDMDDIISYILGRKKGEKTGRGTVIIEGNEYSFSDPNHDGHIIVTKVEGNNE